VSLTRLQRLPRLVDSGRSGDRLIGLFVFGAFDGSQPPNAPDDPGLGLGAMLVTAALTPVLAALLWLGGGIGILFRRMRS